MRGRPPDRVMAPTPAEAAYGQALRRTLATLAATPERGPRLDTALVAEREVAGGSIDGGAPEEALRFFSRWWQLETYLRELTYTELRCRFGLAYTEQLDPQSRRQAERDRVNDYMASADAEDPLAYVDAGRLLGLISEHWELFAQTLLPRRRWEPNIELLRELRNRVSHCRRPHSQDLPRLDMLLGDLERGAQRFFASYTDTGWAFSRKDPVARAWLSGKHPDACLIEHAERQYTTRMHLKLSRRPWAADPERRPVSGEPGYLWHVVWILEGRELAPRTLWSRLSEMPEVEKSVVHLLFPNPFQVGVTLASVEDPQATNETIARLFEAVLEESEPKSYDGDLEAALDRSRWRAGAEDLPRKVGVESLLASFDPYNPQPAFGT
jgi:hypothetical protein